MQSGHSGDEVHTSHPKYKTFASEVEAAVAAFDRSREWADLISCLQRLMKVLGKYKQFPLVPEKEVIAKRLAQCLNPSLPSGVHLKALEAYECVFQRIGTTRLAKDISMWSFGLFPVFAHAATQVRPLLLRIMKSFYVPLKSDLALCMNGLVLALLPGLEESTSESYPEVLQVLDALGQAAGTRVLFSSLWRAILTTPAARTSALNYMNSRIPKVLEEGEFENMFPDLTQRVRPAICAALGDSALLTQRAALDCLTGHLQISSPMLSFDDSVIIATSALPLFTRRELSLSRRLLSWINLADNGEESSENAKMDDRTRHVLIAAVEQLCSSSYSSAHGSTLPFRVMTALLERDELGPHLLCPLILPLLRAAQSTDAESSFVKERQQVARILFQQISQKIVWKVLTDSIDAAWDNVDSSKIKEITSIAQFSLDFMSEIRDDEMNDELAKALVTISSIMTKEYKNNDVRKEIFESWGWEEECDETGLYPLQSPVYAKHKPVHSVSKRQHQKILILLPLCADIARILKINPLHNHHDKLSSKLNQFELGLAVDNIALLISVFAALLPKKSELCASNETRDATDDAKGVIGGGGGEDMWEKYFVKRKPLVVSKTLDALRDAANTQAVAVMLQAQEDINNFAAKMAAEENIFVRDDVQVVGKNNRVEHKEEVDGEVHDVDAAAVVVVADQVNGCKEEEQQGGVGDKQNDDDDDDFNNIEFQQYEDENEVHVVVKKLVYELVDASLRDGEDSNNNNEGAIKENCVMESELSLGIDEAALLEADVEEAEENGDDVDIDNNDSNVETKSPVKEDINGKEEHHHDGGDVPIENSKCINADDRNNNNNNSNSNNNDNEEQEDSTDGDGDLDSMLERCCDLFDDLVILSNSEYSQSLSVDSILASLVSLCQNSNISTACAALKALLSITKLTRKQQQVEILNRCKISGKPGMRGGAEMLWDFMITASDNDKSLVKAAILLLILGELHRLSVKAVVASSLFHISGSHGIVQVQRTEQAIHTFAMLWKTALEQRDSNDYKMEDSFLIELMFGILQASFRHEIASIRIAAQGWVEEIAAIDVTSIIDPVICQLLPHSRSTEGCIDVDRVCTSLQSLSAVFLFASSFITSKQLLIGDAMRKRIGEWEAAVAAKMSPMKQSQQKEWASAHTSSSILMLPTHADYIRTILVIIIRLIATPSRRYPANIVQAEERVLIAAADALIIVVENMGKISASDCAVLEPLIELLAFAVKFQRDQQQIILIRVMSVFNDRLSLQHRGGILCQEKLRGPFISAILAGISGQHRVLSAFRSWLSLTVGCLESGATSGGVGGTVLQTGVAIPIVTATCDAIDNLCPSSYDSDSSHRLCALLVTVATILHRFALDVPMQQSTTALTQGPLDLRSGVRGFFSGFFVAETSAPTESPSRSISASGDRMLFLQQLPSILESVIMTWGPIQCSENKMPPIKPCLFPRLPIDVNFSDGNPLAKGECGSHQYAVRRCVQGVFAPLIKFAPNQTLAALLHIWDRHKGHTWEAIQRTIIDILSSNEDICPAQVSSVLLQVLCEALRSPKISRNLSSDYSSDASGDHNDTTTTTGSSGSSSPGRHGRSKASTARDALLLADGFLRSTRRPVEISQSLGAIMDGIRDAAQHSDSAITLILLMSYTDLLVRKVPLVMDDRGVMKKVQDTIQILSTSCLNLAASAFSTEMRVAHLYTNEQQEQQQQQQDDVFNEGLELGRTGSSDAFDGSAAGNQVSNRRRMTSIKVAVQSLLVLSEVLGRLFGKAWEDNEKPAAMVGQIVLTLRPMLRMRFVPLLPLTKAASKLLASFTSCPYSFRSWRKEVSGAFFEGDFFNVDTETLTYWKSLIDIAVSHERDTFEQLIIRTGGGTMMFVGRDTDIATRASFLKRLAFVILSGETDQYVFGLPLVLERLVDAIRAYGDSSIVCIQVFLVLRVLIFRFSSNHLVSVWPFVISQLIRVLPSPNHDADTVYAALRLIDLLMLLQPEDFQLHSWAFLSDEPPLGSWHSQPFVDMILTMHLATPAAPSSATSPTTTITSSSPSSSSHPTSVHDPLAHVILEAPVNRATCGLRPILGKGKVYSLHDVAVAAGALATRWYSRIPSRAPDAVDIEFVERQLIKDFAERD